MDRNLNFLFNENSYQTDPKHIIFPLNPDNILNNIESILVSDVNIPCLAIETLLVVLCLNYSKDHWIRLKMICDIAELIKRNQNLNWEKIIEQAIQLNRSGQGSISI